MTGVTPDKDMFLSPWGFPDIWDSAMYPVVGMGGTGGTVGGAAFLE